MCAVVRLSVVCTDNFTNKNDLVRSKFSSLGFVFRWCRGRCKEKADASLARSQARVLKGLVPQLHN